MQRFGVRRGGTSPASESRVLKLKGLPYSVRESDLQQFFRDFHLLEVKMVKEPDGRPSGMAFAEFESSEESVKAMNALNGDYIGDRYVKLLRVPHEEMAEQTGEMATGFLGAAGLAIGQGPGFGYLQHQQPQLMAQHQHQQASQQDVSLAQQQQLQQLQQQQQQQQRHLQQLAAGWDPMRGPQPFGGYAGGLYSGGTPNLNGSQHNVFQGIGLGGGLGGFSGGLGPWASNGGGQPAISLPADTGEKPIAVLIAEQQAVIREAQRAAVDAAQAAVAAPSFQQALAPQLNSAAGGLHGGAASQHAATPPLAQGQSAVVGQTDYLAHRLGNMGPLGGDTGMPKQRIMRSDGSTIKMRGLPFRATPEDIYAFFDGFKLHRDSLHLGTDARGRPSGEGWLTFESAEEALRATNARQRQYLGSRYLEISLC